jgi:hypothetical protein
MSPERMQVVDFYKLTRPVQERFLGSVRGSGMPVPILEVRMGPKEPWAWLGLSGASAILLLVLYRLGYGVLDSGLAIQSPPLVAAYALVVATFAFGILRAFALWRDARVLPYRPGVYVFPIGVIDARRYQMRVYPFSDLQTVEGPKPQNQFVLAFAGGAKFTFPASDATKAEQALRSLNAARSQHQEATSARDSIRPKAIAAIDPLQDGGFASPLVPKSPIPRAVPFWSSRSWLVAPAIGLLVGLGLWNGRNILSDEQMFAKAKAKNDAASYKAYLARGSRHQDEAAMTLLPRAELKDAKANGSVDAIEAYIKAHPKTKIQNEVSAALRAAMVAELEKTKEAGTVTALQDFAKRHPDHHLEGELAAATHAVYMTAIERYKAKANPKEPAAAAFVEKLVLLAEKKGPRVEIRFQRQMGKTMDRVDSAVSKHRLFMGTQSLPSRYFDVNRARPREQECAKVIAAKFASVFPSDVLELVLGEPIADPEAPLPAATVPTLFIEHAAEWSGALTPSESPRGIFAGTGLLFDAQFKLPEEPKGYRFKFPSWRAPSLSGMKGEEKPEEKIYENAARDEFELFEKKFLWNFFKEEPKAK